MAWTCADDTCLLPHDHAGKCVPYVSVAKPLKMPPPGPFTDFIVKKGAGLWRSDDGLRAPKAPAFPVEEGPAC